MLPGGWFTTTVEVGWLPGGWFARAVEVLSGGWFARGVECSLVVGLPGL